MADDGEVGYGRPPKHSRFKPGQSGNPQGRRPQFGNFEADLLEELSSEVAVREEGVEHKISKQRAIVNAIVAAAIAGNMRASVALLGIFARASAARAAPHSEFSQDDDMLVKGFENRQRRSEAIKGAKKTSRRSARNET
jgi:uncharacterized protein DUF5681